MFSMLQAWDRAQIHFFPLPLFFSWLCMILWAQEHRTFIFYNLRLSLQDKQFWKILQDWSNVTELFELKKKEVEHCGIIFLSPFLKELHTVIFFFDFFCNWI